MLTRKAIADMQEWKRTKTHQALLVLGARQVGKTTAIRTFADAEYTNVVEINFLDNPAAVSLVSESENADDLFRRLSILSGKSLSEPSTLLFLDEIQECQDVLTWIKFLEERRDIDVVLSGSLLGLDAFVNVRSLPVGFLSVLTMYPLDFEEFTWANGITDDTWAYVRECLEALRPIPEFIHDKLTYLFKLYLIAGGMPEVVQQFVNTDDVAIVRAAERRIVDLYEDDIAKYVHDIPERRQIKMVYTAIPGQLNAPSKRFKYARLGKNLRFANMETAFDWLAAAGVALAVTRVGSMEFPLGFSEDRNAMKLFMNDVGLLTSQLMGNVGLDVLMNNGSINYGSVYENAVAQELVSQKLAPHYYASKQIGEVDFVIENKATGEVMPIEVKSGKAYKRHSALTNLLKKYLECDKAVVLHSGNVELADKVRYLPAYTAGSIALQFEPIVGS